MDDVEDDGTAAADEVVIKPGIDVTGLCITGVLNKSVLLPSPTSGGSWAELIGAVAELMTSPPNRSKLDPLLA